MGEEFVAAYRAAEALGQGFNVARDFWCCDRVVNVTLQVRA